MYPGFLFIFLDKKLNRIYENPEFGSEADTSDRGFLQKKSAP